MIIKLIREEKTTEGGFTKTVQVYDEVKSFRTVVSSDTSTVFIKTKDDEHLIELQEYNKAFVMGSNGSTIETIKNASSSSLEITDKAVTFGVLPNGSLKLKGKEFGKL